MITIKLEDQLSKDGKILTTVHGNSMMPLLRQDRDTVIIQLPEALPKKGDVVLYKREEGSNLVLHRVTGFKDGVYTTRGDNRFITERVLPSQVIGVMESFYRDEKHIVCKESKGYSSYVAFISATYFLRYLIHLILRGIKKIVRGLKK